MTVDEATALFTGVAALAAMATAWIAFVTLRSLQRDSHDRTRPVVIAKLERPPLSPSLVLVVENSGASPARNLVVKFNPDPLLIEGDPREPDVAKYILQRYSRPIPLLPAGDRLGNVYFSGREKNSQPLPDEFQVIVAYTDLEGRNTYEDTFDLDVNVHRKETFSTPGDSDMPKRTAKALEAIANQIGRHR